MTHADKRPRPLAMALALLAASLCLVCAPAAGQERPPWWDRRWRFRKLLKRTPRQQWPNAPAASAWIHIRPSADHGGRDLRVVTPKGRPVSFDVVHSTPDGRYLLAFAVPERQGFYAVYYDNPAAPAVQRKRPDVGLLHYTMPIPDGLNSARAPAAMQACRR